MQDGKIKQFDNKEKWAQEYYYYLVVYIYRGKASEVTEEENKWKKERGG